MVITPNNAKDTTQKKKRSSVGGLKKKKPTAYNKFMSEEMTRLRVEKNVEDGTERRKQANEAWKKHKEE